MVLIAVTHPGQFHRGRAGTARARAAAAQGRGAAPAPPAAQPGHPSGRLIVAGDVVNFNPAGTPNACGLQSRFRRGDRVGFRMTARDGGTGDLENTAVLVAHVTFAGKTVDVPMRWRGEGRTRKKTICARRTTCGPGHGSCLPTRRSARSVTPSPRPIVSGARRRSLLRRHPVATDHLQYLSADATIAVDPRRARRSGGPRLFAHLGIARRIRDAADRPRPRVCTPRAHRTTVERWVPRFGGGIRSSRRQGRRPAVEDGHGRMGHRGLLPLPRQEVHGVDLPLGRFTVDAHGRLEARFVIPEDYGGSTTSSRLSTASPSRRTVSRSRKASR